MSTEELSLPIEDIADLEGQDKRRRDSDSEWLRLIAATRVDRSKSCLCQANGHAVRNEPRRVARRGLPTIGMWSVSRKFHCSELPGNPQESTVASTSREGSCSGPTLPPREREALAGTRFLIEFRCAPDEHLLLSPHYQTKRAVQPFGD